MSRCRGKTHLRKREAEQHLRNKRSRSTSANSISIAMPPICCLDSSTESPLPPLLSEFEERQPQRRCMLCGRDPP